MEYEGREYFSDVFREINKFENWYIDPGEVTDEQMILKKKRLYTVVSSMKVNNPKSDRYWVAPIRNEHDYEVNANTLDFIVAEKAKVGRIYIPIEVKPGEFSFIDMSMTTCVASSQLKAYKNTIGNPVTREKIDRALYDIFLSGSNIVELIETKETIHKNEVKQSSVSQKLEHIEEDSTSTKKGHSRKKIPMPENFVEVYNDKKAGKYTNQQAADLLGLTFSTFCRMSKRYEEEKENGINTVIEKKETNKSNDTKKKPLVKLPRGFSKYVELHEQRKMTVKEIAKKIGKSEPTVYNYIKIYKESQANLEQKRKEMKNKLEEKQKPTSPIISDEFKNIMNGVNKGFMTQQMAAHRMGITLKDFRGILKEYNESNSVSV
jgi:transposase